MYSDSYQKVLNDIIELVVFSNNAISITEAEEIGCVEFEYYKNIFKEKYTKDIENKKEFIQNTFEFARKAVETICKTIINAWGIGISGLFGGKK